MIGVERRKENRADELRSSPLKSPADMVMPERDTPGTSATACDMPINHCIGEVQILKASVFKHLFRKEHYHADHDQG